MLMDILGIVIAFASAMLVFSLLVTALVQFIQAVFNIRYRNLKVGVHLLTERLREDTGGLSMAARNQLDWFIDSRYRTGLFSLHLKVTYVAKDDVIRAIERMSDITIEERDRLLEKTGEIFPLVERYMEQRFQRIAHILAVTVSLAIAIIYQINAPDLLRDLSVNPELREKYMKYAQERTVERESKLPPSSYGLVVSMAIERLVAAHPEEREVLEPLSGDGVDDEATALLELSDALSDRPEAFAKLKDEYAGYLRDELERGKREAGELLEKRMSDVAQFNFQISPKGSSYYLDYSRGIPELIGNWSGVLISAVLISLGAPFWFNTLQNLLSLKDKFDPKKKK